MKPLLNRLLLFLVPMSLGLGLGFYATSDYYKGKMLKEAEAYKASVEAARTREAEWRKKADEQELQYQRDLESVRTSNDAELDRLRKQLRKQASRRMSAAPKSSSKHHAEAGEAKLAAAVSDLAEYSDRCSRRADELIVQVNALQAWIKTQGK